MKEYNSAFFGLFENLFIVLKEYYDEDIALSFFRKLMEKGLTKAYGDNFVKGDPETFVKLVGERDNNVGLQVEFPIVEKNKLVYQFHTDPFPGLKDIVKSEKLDNTYMKFKVKNILGVQWNYRTTQHIWKNGKYTEHVITKNI